MKDIISMDSCSFHIYFLPFLSFLQPYLSIKRFLPFCIIMPICSTFACRYMPSLLVFDGGCVVDVVVVLCEPF